MFPNGVLGGGEPASFSVSTSLCGRSFRFGEPYSGAESLIFSLRSAPEGVRAGVAEVEGRFWGRLNQRFGLLQAEACALQLTWRGQVLLSSSGASADVSRSGACAAWSTDSGIGSPRWLGATSSSEYLSAITGGGIYVQSQT